MKLGTGADPYIITTENLKKLNLPAKLVLSNYILTCYSCRTIPHQGSLKLKITHKKKTVVAHFKVVDASSAPSVRGCIQSIQLEIISNGQNVIL